MFGLPSNVAINKMWHCGSWSEMLQTSRMGHTENVDVKDATDVLDTFKKKWPRIYVNSIRKKQSTMLYLIKSLDGNVSARLR